MSIREATVLFIIGGLISVITVVQLRGCGPTLADRINEGVCTRLKGTWVERSHQCIFD